MIFNLELDTKNSYRALGRLIKFYRMIAGYSLRDLGTLVNISHTLIANIEQGKVKGSTETLKDIFKALHIDFTNVDDIFDEFKETYDNAFDYLYKYEYTRAKGEMEKLLAKEQTYIHSVLITDYGLLKFLYFVLLGKEPKDQYIDVKVYRGVVNNFSDRQRQIYYLIEGIYAYNNGTFAEGVEYLNKALKIGDSNLDHLVKVFLIKCYVKTHHFMQVMKIGNETIDFFESRVIYLRAMEVRLSIAYSYILNKNFVDAKTLLDSVYHFSNNFNAGYLIREAKMLLGSYYILLKDFDTAREYIYSIDSKESILYFLKMRIAFRQDDQEEMVSLYHEFKNSPEVLKVGVQELVVDLVSKEMGIIEMSDVEFLKNMNAAIEFGVKAHDIEVIDSCYNILIRHYQSKRMYKKAFEASQKARDIMKNGCLKHKSL